MLSDASIIKKSSKKIIAGAFIQTENRTEIQHDST